MLPDDLKVIEAVFLDRYSVNNLPLYTNYDNVKSTWRRCEMKPSMNERDGNVLLYMIDGLSRNENISDNSSRGDGNINNNSYHSSRLEDLIEVEHYNDVNDNINKIDDRVDVNEDNIDEYRFSNSSQMDISDNGSKSNQDDEDLVNNSN